MKIIPVELQADLWEMIFLKGKATVSDEQYEVKLYAVTPILVTFNTRLFWSKLSFLRNIYL